MSTRAASDSFFFLNDPATTEIYTLSLHDALPISVRHGGRRRQLPRGAGRRGLRRRPGGIRDGPAGQAGGGPSGRRDRKSTRLNSSHPSISYAVFCLKKKKTHTRQHQSQPKLVSKY